MNKVSPFKHTGFIASSIFATMFSSPVFAEISCDSESTEAKHHYIQANNKTVHWGYFSKNKTPQAIVHSGDFVTLETLTHHANDDAERMVKGDPGAESVFKWAKK
jgi:hypothetical protein